MEYRIVILDEDPRMRRGYAEALVAEPPLNGVTYKITTTGSAAAAQLQATRQRYHVLIATMGAHCEWVGLATRLYELYPEIRLLLLRDRSAPAAVADAGRRLGARVIDLPVSNDALRRLVREMLGMQEPTIPQPEESERPPATLADVQLLLDVLRRQAKAQLVLYNDNIGNIIAQRGSDTGLELTALSSLIAGSFVNSMEMGHVLQDPETSHLSVHEGRRYDVYSTSAGANRMIALVFDKEFVQPKLGFVWLLLKRGAEQLRNMRIIEGNVEEVLTQQLTASLNSEFDRLFGNELISKP